MALVECKLEYSFHKNTWLEDWRIDNDVLSIDKYNFWNKLNKFEKKKKSL